MKRKLDLKNPLSFSEKIQYIKLGLLNDSEKCLCTDKISVKAEIKKKVPTLKVADVYQICNSFDEIDFEKLPNSFVIKTNHYCGSNFFVKEKKYLNSYIMKKLKKYYNTILRRNFAYEAYFEMQYKNIKPQILVEEYIGDINKNICLEYKVHCFNEKVMYIVVNYKFLNGNRYTYDTKLYYIDKSCIGQIPENKIINPKTENKKFIHNFEDAIKYSEILCKGHKLVRVDLYCVDGILYFGELTFTPNSGFFEKMNHSMDLFTGKFLSV